MRAALLLLLTGLFVAGPGQAFKSGLDPSSFDSRVRPQDDLYRFANGKWLDTAVIPADRVSWGTLRNSPSRRSSTSGASSKRSTGAAAPNAKSGISTPA